MKREHYALVVLLIGAGLVGWSQPTWYQAIALVVGIYLIGWSQIMDWIDHRNRMEKA